MSCILCLPPLSGPLLVLGFFFFNFESLAFCGRPSEQRVQVALGIDAQKRRRIRGAMFPLTALQQLLGDALTHASTSGGQRSDSE